MMMTANARIRRLLLAALVVLALLGGFALAAASTSGAALAGPPPRSGPPLIVPSGASGGGYQLAPTTWQVTGYLQGGAYRLGREPKAGEGCCCTGYLPCLVR